MYIRGEDMILELTINRDILIRDIIDAFNFFSKESYKQERVKELVEEKIKNLNFDNKNMAHFGTNRIAKEIIEEII